MQEKYSNELLSDDESENSYYTDSEIEDEIENELEDDLENLNEITTQITTKGISAIYHEYLKDNKLLLSPEYQRDLCWSTDKMVLFIDTIMKSWIVPNYVIYKLTSKETKDTDHSYECVDGQHRLTSIKWFMEGTRDPYTKKYVYYKIGKERIFYNLTVEQLEEVRKNTPRGYKIRNFTKMEKNKFDDYQMSFHIISSKNRLSIQTKCSIFNRLQNGERVASYEKLKNNPNNKITNCIRKEQLLKLMNDLKFTEIFDIPKMRKYEGFNIYFLIRAFLIIDKKNLSINYLDMNIKQSIEANDGDGAPCVKLKNSIDDLLEDVKDVINFIGNNKSISKKIIPELAYIYICIYANYGEDVLDKVIKRIKSDPKDYNKKTKYKSTYGKVTSSELINIQYEDLKKQYINSETSKKSKTVI
jgi:hypothetical protein